MAESLETDLRSSGVAHQKKDLFEEATVGGGTCMWLWEQTTLENGILDTEMRALGTAVSLPLRNIRTPLRETAVGYDPKGLKTRCFRFEVVSNLCRLERAAVGGSPHSPYPVRAF